MISFSRGVHSIVQFAKPVLQFLDDDGKRKKIEHQNRIHRETDQTRRFHKQKYENEHLHADDVDIRPQ